MGKRLSKFDIEALERRARGRAAWGAWSGYVRTQNYRHELAEHNEAIRSASDSEAREKAEAKKKKFIDNAGNSNGLYIG